MFSITELPREIQQKIWDEVRFKMQKDKYNKVVGELKRFVKEQRRKKYYISKYDPDNKSMFMYLNFTLDITLDIFSGGYRDNTWSRNTWLNHQSYTFYIWSRYLDEYSTYHQPIRKPTVKLIITNFLWDIHCFNMKMYHFFAGSVFVEPPERYGYYYDQYYNDY